MAVDWVTPLLSGMQKGAAGAYGAMLYAEDEKEKKAQKEIENKRKEREFAGDMLGTLDKYGFTLDPLQKYKLATNAWTTYAGTEVTPDYNQIANIGTQGLSKETAMALFKMAVPNASNKELLSFGNTVEGLPLDQQKPFFQQLDKKMNKTMEGLSIEKQNQYNKDVFAKAKEIAHNLNWGLVKGDPDYDPAIYKYNEYKPNQQEIDDSMKAAKKYIQGDMEGYQQEIEKLRNIDKEPVRTQIKLWIQDGYSDKKIQNKLKKQKISHYTAYYTEIPKLREGVMDIEEKAKNNFTKEIEMYKKTGLTDRAIKEKLKEFRGQLEATLKMPGLTPEQIKQNETLLELTKKWL